MRPEAGAQRHFKPSKSPQTYRYDSSLAPELQWDEAEARGEAEQLLNSILNADSLDAAKAAAAKLQRGGSPFLNWAGKAERDEFSVPTMPLFVHERLSTEAILDTLKRHKRDRKGVLDLFGEGDKSITDKISGAYTHKNGWQNRLILGDSLRVGNSLLQYENMAGTVQMVYMDPPYGIKFGGNFQPFVRRRNVKDGDDAHITREPEMVKAYRDTWELGIHSWLTYMRDRLLLMRELLHDSGSCFVQISDKNVHLVRSVMDEIFGRENFVSLIAYKTTSGMSQKSAPRRICDYLIWYAKDSEQIKFNRLYVKSEIDTKLFRMVEDNKNNRRVITEEERKNPERISNDLRLYRTLPLHSRSDGNKTPREFAGEQWTIPAGSWRYSLEGFNRLAEKGRIVKEKKVISAIRFFDDFPYKEMPSYWDDTGPELDKHYVVQTAEKVIQRCMLMTTDPGDLVFDPTCGSGTTAVVAEQWGRRWITTDVSRVPLALARQRLLTKTYPYYQLMDGKNPGSGFVYKRKQNKKGEEVGGIVPNVTLKSLANNELPQEEVLVDKPEKDTSLTRISGPFCVEAIMPPASSPMLATEEDNRQQERENRGGGGNVPYTSATAVQNEENYIPRMVEILRQSPVIRLPKNEALKLENVRPVAKSLTLHAEAKFADSDRWAGVVFGPATAAIVEPTIIAAAEEAKAKRYTRLLVIAYEIDSHARVAVERGEAVFGITITYAQASTDLVMGDLLKSMRSSEIFSVCGMPEVEVNNCGEENNEPLYQVKLIGLDVFNPANMETAGLQGDDVPCWMLDTDYDGQCFRAGQVFFPRTGAWDKIKKAVRAEFNDSVWAHLAGDTSEPFVAGENRQVAIKVIDERGNELMVIEGLGDVKRDANANALKIPLAD